MYYYSLQIKNVIQNKQTKILSMGCNEGTHVQVTFVCRVQDDDDNGYKPSLHYILSVTYKIIHTRDISSKCGDGSRNFVLNITEMACHNILQ
jgi:hypothetical protein